jgi:hypothetical protein
MDARAAGLLLALLGAAPGGSPHFQVSASFVAPAQRGGNASVAVTFVARDPDVNVNEDPAPRLKLDSAQRVLVDRQPPASTKPPAFDPDNPRYLDLELPVLFPVGIAPGAPKGPQKVKATVVYFYCSKREGWCRRGTADVEFMAR